MSAIRGVALAGGSAYDPAQLAEFAPLRAITSGLPTLDAVACGVQPGSVWAIVGPRGAGVTELALGYAMHAVVQQGQRVLVVNGHLTAATLGRRLAVRYRGAAGLTTGPLSDEDVTDSLSALRPERLSIASWLPLPAELPSGEWDWATDALASRDLIVYDTLDEASDVAAAAPGEARIAVLRGLRAAARRSNAGVIVTARLAPVDLDAAATRSAWRGHAMYESIQDAADVIVTVVDGGDGDANVRVESRCARGGVVGLHRDEPHGLFRCAGRHHRLPEYR